MLRIVIGVYLLLTTTGTYFWYQNSQSPEVPSKASIKAQSQDPFPARTGTSNPLESPQIKGSSMPRKETKRTRWTVFVPSIRLPYLQRSPLSINPDLPPLELLNNLVEATGLTKKVEGVYARPVRTFFVEGDRIIIDLQAGYADLLKGSDLRSVQNLFSLVNSILENVSQDRVLLLFQGKPFKLKGSELNLIREMTFNPSIIEPGSKSET